MWIYHLSVALYIIVFIKRLYGVQGLKTRTETDRANPYPSTTASWNRSTLLKAQKWSRAYCSKVSKTWRWRWLLRPNPSRIRTLLNSSKSCGSCPTFILRSECWSKLRVWNHANGHRHWASVRKAFLLLGLGIGVVVICGLRSHCRCFEYTSWIDARCYSAPQCQDSA